MFNKFATPDELEELLELGATVIDLNEVDEGISWSSLTTEGQQVSIYS